MCVDICKQRDTYAWVFVGGGGGTSHGGSDSATFKINYICLQWVFASDLVFEAPTALSDSRDAQPEPQRAPNAASITVLLVM